MTDPPVGPATHLDDVSAIVEEELKVAFAGHWFESQPASRPDPDPGRLSQVAEFIADAIAFKYDFVLKAKREEQTRRPGP